MRHDPIAIVREIRAALEHIQPAGSIHGSAPGVDIELGFDGAVADLSLDPAAYRITSAGDLGAAIVAAHTDARMAAISAVRQIVPELNGGIDERLSSERLTAGAPGDGVAVVMRLDGFLESVDIAAWLPRRYLPRYVAQLVMETIREAEVCVGQRLAAGKEWT